MTRVIPNPRTNDLHTAVASMAANAIDGDPDQRATAAIVGRAASTILTALQNYFTPGVAAAHAGTPRINRNGQTITATGEVSLIPHPPQVRFEHRPYVAAEEQLHVFVAVTRTPRRPAPAPVKLETSLARALSRKRPGKGRDGWTVVANNQDGKYCHLVITDRDGRLFAATWEGGQPWKGDRVTFHPVIARPRLLVEYLPA